MTALLAEVPARNDDGLCELCDAPLQPFVACACQTALEPDTYDEYLGER